MEESKRCLTCFSVLELLKVRLSDFANCIIVVNSGNEKHGFAISGVYIFKCFKLQISSYVYLIDHCVLSPYRVLSRDRIDLIPYVEVDIS